MSGMEALGRLLDVGHVWTPQDFHTSGVTGAWVSLKRASGVLFVVQFKAGTSGDNATLTLQEATTFAGAGNQNLAVIDHWYLKANATPTSDLTGAEVWVQETQAAAATVVATAAVVTATVMRGETRRTIRTSCVTSTAPRTTRSSTSKSRSERWACAFATTSSPATRSSRRRPTTSWR